MPHPYGVIREEQYAVSEAPTTFLFYQKRVYLVVHVHKYQGWNSVQVEASVLLFIFRSSIISLFHFHACYKNISYLLHQKLQHFFFFFCCQENLTQLILEERMVFSIVSLHVFLSSVSYLKVLKLSCMMNISNGNKIMNWRLGKAFQKIVLHYLNDFALQAHVGYWGWKLCFVSILTSQQFEGLTLTTEPRKVELLPILLQKLLIVE